MKKNNLRQPFASTYYFFVCILFLGAFQLQAIKHPERGLLVFLDQEEKEYIDAISAELSIALAQKAGPILASTAVLKNVFSEYGKNIDDPSYGNLFQSAIAKITPQEHNTELALLFKKTETFYNSPERDAYKYILLKAIRFTPNQWIIKRVNEFLHLLIPITYLQDKGIDIQHVLQDNAQIISDTELTLGLRINHMQTITIENVLQQHQPTPRPDHVIQALYDETSEISSIFCLRSEYFNRSIAIPSWTIFMEGHGTHRSKIAGVDIKDFKKILPFLEYKILCKLLVYNTCYSGGSNIQEIYKDTTRDLQDTYSFPIIMHALTDAVIFSTTLDVELNNNDELQVVNSISFATFLQKAENSPFLSEEENSVITAYNDIVKHIFKLRHMNPNNTPQIKMPGLEWFLPLDTDQIVGIGHILAASRSPDAPLEIVSFFNKYPRILLLYASDIPFTLELNPKLEAIVSMIPGIALHTLHGLSSDSQSINKILNMFMKIKNSSSEKLFFIKNIKNIEADEESAQDVLITYLQSHDKSYEYHAYYLYNNQLFIKSDTEDDDISRIATPQEAQKYQHYVQQITGKPQIIKRATYYHNDLVGQNNPPITLSSPLPLYKHAIIETIEVPSGTALDDIIDAIILMQPKDAVTLVKEVIVSSSDDQAITRLKNILYDEKNNKLFFTVNGRFFLDDKELPQDYMPYYMKILTSKTHFSIQPGSLLPTSITSDDAKSIKKAISPERREYIKESLGHLPNQEGYLPIQEAIIKKMLQQERSRKRKRPDEKS